MNKPAGLVVHPGAGTPEGTLVNGLVARYPGIVEVGAPERPESSIASTKTRAGCWPSLARTGRWTR